ncbi:MAG: LamG-like jellyroll fold domain-containing protein, partial [Cyanobacteria bacterium J06642_11]
MLDTFIRTYSANRTYRHTTMVRHEGTVIAFAIDNQRRIYYSVLDLENTSIESPLDVNFWSDNPAELRFPNELSQMGFGIADQYALPTVAQGQRTPASPNIRVPVDEVDTFLSSTARLTADAPFQVLSDGRFVYIFRQSVAAGDDNNVMRLDEDGEPITDLDGKPVPLVTSSLLLDRFVLAGNQLQPCREVRFRRSRSRTRPQSNKDTLGAVDMEERPFIEPTQQLTFVQDLWDGRFSVLLLPTQVVRVERWQIFTHNGRTGQIDSYNVERSADGLFNTRGTEAGVDAGFAESALRFDQPSDRIALTANIVQNITFTQEAWIFPQETVLAPDNTLGQALLSGAAADAPDAPPSIWIEGNTRVRCGFGDGDRFHSVVTNSILTPQRWNHLTVSFDGSSYRIYVNGRLRFRTTADTFSGTRPSQTSLNFIGSPTAAFHGLVDEVRLWTRARTPGEIERDMHQRLTGQEPDLQHYWRFDEGSGNRVNDQTGNSQTGTISGLDWVTSTAPIGNNSSINRSSFGLEERRLIEGISEEQYVSRTIQSGLSSVLYYHQENATTGYDQEEKPLRQSARVMLAVATQAEGATREPRNEIVTLDFGVSARGMLTQVPDNLRLPKIDAVREGELSVNEQLDQISQRQQAIIRLQDKVKNLGESIQELNQGSNQIRQVVEFNNPSNLLIPTGIENLDQRSMDSFVENLQSPHGGLTLTAALEQLVRDRNHLRDRQRQLQALRNNLQNARATVYEHINYRGRRYSFGVGEVSFGAINRLGMNDRISGINLSAPLPGEPQPIHATLYEHANRRGVAVPITQPEPSFVSRDFQRRLLRLGIIFFSFNDRVSSMEITVNPVFSQRLAAVEAEVNQAQAVVDALEADLRRVVQTLLTIRNQRQTNRSQAQQDLAQLQQEQTHIRRQLDNGVSVAMPLLHTDRTGLSLSGGILGFAWTIDTPTLYDSAVGRLALYFRGADDQFFVTYYDTLTQRPRFELSDDQANTTVICASRAVEAEFDRLAMRLTGEPGADTCTVDIGFMEFNGATGIDELRPVETWRQVPRQPQQFADVLNGLAGDRTFVGTGSLQVEAGRADSLFMATGVERSLPLGATLIVGDIQVTLREAVPSGATQLPIESNVVNPPQERRPVFYLAYDYGTQASTTQASASLLDGSLLVAAASTNQGEQLQVNQVAQPSPTLSSRWVAASPGMTLAFNGADSVAVAPNDIVNRFGVDGDLTLEAWMRPNQVNGQAQVIHQQSADGRYLMGLEAAELLSALRLDGTDDVVRIPNQPQLNFAGEITLEAWIKIAQSADTSQVNNLVAHGFVDSLSEKGEVFLRINQDRYEVGAWDGTGHLTTYEIPEADTNGQTWVHLAGVYDGTTWRLYRNGEEVANTMDAVGARRVNADWAIGGHPTIPARRFNGSIDEVRIWQRTRTEEEIRRDRSRRLSGNERGLVGYWHFDGAIALDYSRYENHGVVVGSPTAVASPLSAYRLFTGTGNQLVRTHQVVPGGNWTHWSTVYNQSYALQFRGEAGSFLDCGNNTTLDLNQDLTIEAFVQVDTLNQPQGLLTKGTFSNIAEDEAVPYSFYINTSGQLVFVFEDVGHGKRIFTSDAGQPLVPSQFYRVAVTRQRQTTTDQQTDSDGLVAVDVNTQYDIVFYINGIERGRRSYRSGRGQPRDIGSNAQAAEIGSGYPFIINRAHAISINSGRSGTLPNNIRNNRISPEELDLVRQVGRFLGFSEGNLPSRETDIDAVRQVLRRVDQGFPVAPLTGYISELRLWNVARGGDNVGGNIQGTESGLVSWWQLEENDGNVATDAKSSNHAQIKGQVDWVANPDPQGSSLVVYRDGQTVDTIAIAADQRVSAEAQFTLGAVRRGGLQDFFQGEMEEVRIWQQARTQEQIQDNLFRRLQGNREQLVAYYTFDPEREGNQTQLSDRSLQANTLAVDNGTYVLSTAPIGDETPQVRSALAGVRTPFHGVIQTQPAVAEYGDLQYDSENNLIGVFKRCYTTICKAEWQLISGFAVGDLVTEWVGQVQFDPQLIGYIEGAPPVPSENLTQEDSYNSATSIEINDVDSTTFTYAASKDRGFDSEFETSLTAGFGSETSVGGIGILSKANESNVLTGARAKFENTLSWLEGATTGSGRTTGRISRLDLRGRLENEDEVAHRVGRRFVPENIGFALVQSDTADVFALRLQHNNALVSLQMRPNPDIPPDRNIITFPINPAYTKQGTLDGKVGLEPDVNYPNALTYSSDSSYFKPIEAYNLRDRIQREEEQIAAYYQQYNAGKTGRRQGGSNLTTGNAVEKLPRIQKRNIVNNYVWTANGGTFAESQETLDVVQETTGGSYAFRGVAGIDVAIDFQLGGAASQFALQALFGGHLNLTVTKSQETESTFGLNVDLEGVESDVFLRDDTGRIVTENDNPLNPNRPLRQPGKVDAYRFLSFYLEPHSNNLDTFFSQVVDPIWLEQSNDANAAALRQAQQQEKRPPCWRVMHRITYVSRVLPRFSDPNMPPLEQALPPLNIDSNYELIRRLEPYVIDQVNNYAAFVRAVRQAVATYLPDLQPHTDTIVQFMQLYYGISEETGLIPRDDLPELPDGRAPNRAPIVDAGVSQDVTLSDDVQLQGAIADDRLDNSALFLTWTQLSGPGKVDFSDLHALGTLARFSQRGVYQFRLTANDGLLSASDDLTIVVNEAPVVNAGNNIEAGPGETVELLGELLDNGLGDPSTGEIGVQWSVENGPGPVTFSNPEALRTTVAFERSGSYMLSLTVNNGLLSTSDIIVVSVAERVMADLEALYTFDRGRDDTQVNDARRVNRALNLTIADTGGIAWNENTLELQSPTQLEAIDTTGLVRAIQASQALTLEAWITPATDSHAGLARILTLSGGARERNFILGQTGDRIHVGIRTSSTNGNASDKALAGGPLEANQLHHVVCTRTADSITHLYVDGTIVASRQIDGDFSTWAKDFSLVLGSERGDIQGNRSWLGNFHLVALYSRALSATEVERNYQFGADTNLTPLVT